MVCLHLSKGWTFSMFFNLYPLNFWFILKDYENCTPAKEWLFRPVTHILSYLDQRPKACRRCSLAFICRYSRYEAGLLGFCFSASRWPSICWLWEYSWTIPIRYWGGFWWISQCLGSFLCRYQIFQAGSSRLSSIRFSFGISHSISSSLEQPNCIRNLRSARIRLKLSQLY